MVTEGLIKMMPEVGVRSMVGGGGDGFVGGEDLEKELGLLLREQRRQDAGDREQERELNMYRSGSAPPTVEGSLAAAGGLFGRDVGAGLSEEELRSDPAYLSYYYSHVNLNPRLPPPVLSKEDWRFTQRLQSGFGGIGDKRKDDRVEEQGSSSLFSLQPGFQTHMDERRMESGNVPGSGEWLDKGGDGLIGLQGLSLGRQKSFADIFQEDHGRTTPVSSYPSRPASRNAFGNGIETLGSAEAKQALPHKIESIDSLQPGGYVQNAAGAQNHSVSASHTFASVLGKSVLRSTTPDPQLVARAPSPSFPSVGGRLSNSDKQHNNGSCPFNGISSGISETDDFVASLSGLRLSATGGIEEDIAAQSKLQQEIENQQKFLFGSQGAQDHINQHPFLSSDSGYLNMSHIPQLPMSSYPDLTRKSAGLMDRTNTGVRSNGQGELRNPPVSSTNSYLRGTSSPSITSPGSPASLLNMDSASGTFPGYGLSGYSINAALASPMTNQIGTCNLPLFENSASAIGSPCPDSRALGGTLSGSNISGIADFQNLSRMGNPAAASALQMPLVDPLYIHYLRTGEYAAQFAANFTDPSLERNYMGNSYMDLLGVQKAYLGSLLQPQKQYGMPFIGKSGGVNNGYYGNPAFGLGMSYPASPLASPVLSGSPGGPVSPLRHGERSIRSPSGLRNFAGGVTGSWHSDLPGNLDNNFPSSLLEEFKSNKTKCYELSEIAGHVVEFSADQYGSRFIQQKLETATTEEKNMVFEEIMPQAFSLMTDVFGNYVIQKFFEHGSASQRRELADQLTGHVLTLSLQMYGCRVIQKAIEVVDLDQQTKMVAELDGHIMRCVRDQNGNHVIQKCIECVPQDAIQFIISSFYDQVVTLSTHPYGCRVIQRVLEYSNDPKTQQIMMDEIMGSVCTLAQDQYGNYVVQMEDVQVERVIAPCDYFSNQVNPQTGKRHYTNFEQESYSYTDKHVLEQGKPHERSAIIKKLAGQIVQMSQQKFASNVVEKCLTFGDPEERQILVNEMLGTTEENEPLQAMMKDQFANYVVQKVLETCDDAQREYILSRIKVHLNALKKYTYGKHIVARVEKLVAAGERRIGVQSSYNV